MRHAKVGRKLSRSASHRKALLSALSVALIKHKRIQTTAAKAKETRRIVEPLITRARDAYMREKSGEPVDIHSRRIIAKFIRDKEALNLLFSEIAEKVGKRQGGYTRVLKLGNRLGDGAEMAVIELVDYNEAQDTKQRKDRVARSKAALQRRKAAEDRKEKAAAAPVAAAQEEVEAPVAEVEDAAAVAQTDDLANAETPETETPAAEASEEEPKA
ncbi:MAG: 50S ribosomal protein L17 [Bacteroidia bacterium]|nr:50S ribosomal protein L17 [Bacteroidia bacterium]